MAFLKEKDKEYINNLFLNLTDDVRILFFTQQIESHYCRETKQLLQEISELSDKINLKTYNFQVDRDLVKEYKIDKIPATVIERDKDSGIRYYGVPSGYELSSLLEDIVDVSNNESGLSEKAKELLLEVKKPVHIQVFVTPTCPYCPKVVRLTHKIALENEHINADMIEATEFPHLAMRYNVQSVPKTIIGEDVTLDGTSPEMVLVEKVLEAYNSSKNKLNHKKR
jgi:glutaredoxin-like protein